jgi:putative transport protein
MLGRYPELGIFLALGLGYLVGNVRFGGFSLGGVTGSLLAGMMVGWMFELPVSATARSLVFLLFMFGIGYEVGPRFFTAMKGDGWRFGVLGAFVPVVGLATAWAVASFMDLDAGFSAGLVAGGLTQSSALGTASEAIQALPVDAQTREMLLAHMGVGDAMCYVFGALGVILMCSVVGPRLLGIDLKAEALAVEKQYGITREQSGIGSALQPFQVRAYRIPEGAPAAGRTVAEVEGEGAAAGVRLFLQRIRRGDGLLAGDPGTVLRAGDVVAVSGRLEALVELVGERADEVDDPALLEMPIASQETWVSRPRWVGRTLAEAVGNASMRGVFLRRILRQGNEIPIGTGTRIERGDRLLLVGAESSVATAAAELGEIVRPTDVTDFAVVGLAITVGALLGAATSVPIGSIHVSIGTSVGTLVAGILTGYARSRRPLFGRVPDGAVRLMQQFGLAGFVAMMGIGSGPHFASALKEAGFGLLIGGAVVTLVPQLVGLWFGRKVLKINPLLLLGALSGAQTFTAALAAVQEKSGSSAAVLGYSGAVPIAHVFLTTWGTVIVLLMH